MGRIATLMLGIFVALSSVHSTQVSADFILGDGTAVSDTVPEEAFKTLENEDKYRGTMQKLLPEAKAQEKEGCVTLDLRELPDKAAYAQFKSLWSNKPSIERMDITAKEFLDFVLAASYLNIQGEYAERFTQNMVKYGLFGVHFADIVSSEVFFNYDLPHDTLWGLLHAFLRQAGFECRLTHPSTEQTVLRIEKADAWPKQIDKEYTGPSQATRMRTVLHTELGPALSQEKERNEAVLAWLLQSIGGSSVDIQYTIEVFSDDIADLTQAIQNLNKENKQGTRVRVEGVVLDLCGRKHSFSLYSVLQLVPDLSRLELSIDRNFYSFKEAPSFLISDISLCQSLKVLTITECILESAEVSSIADSHPNIEQLSLACKNLEETAMDSLKKCTRLERLKISRLRQSITVVQALVMHLPLLRELSIECDGLYLAAAEAFQVCTKLEKLNMLEVYQPSATVQAIVTHLPSLKELKIGIDSADFALADALRNCPNLRFLNMIVKNYTPGFLARYLQAPLPRLTSLELRNNDINHRHSEEDVKAKKKAQELEMSISAYPF
ncbi:hypothetical protein NECID01_2164 [Nematocida sp. AWRm77]|nr:hypothetical protein NECID01_2164 [Nematocida sp. AWRm77]